jgi:hypothetical protein
MKKSIFEAGLAMCTGSKVSKMETKSSIRFVSAQVVKSLKIETPEEVGQLVDFIRMNREVSTTVNTPAMVTFFGDDVLLTVGVSTRFCEVAWPLYRDGKSWSDREAVNS